MALPIRSPFRTTGFDSGLRRLVVSQCVVSTFSKGLTHILWITTNRWIPMAQRQTLGAGATWSVLSVLHVRVTVCILRTCLQLILVWSVPLNRTLDTYLSLFYVVSSKILKYDLQSLWAMRSDQRNGLHTQCFKAEKRDSFRGTTKVFGVPTLRCMAKILAIYLDIHNILWHLIHGRNEAAKIYFGHWNSQI